AVYLWGMAAAYVVSKLAEYYDAEIYAVTGFLSGHSIKHIIAAGGTLFIYLALRNRQALD
ncbi:MAG: alkaline phytoceramidase, partial [Gammaproteobacteria bacterium]|nr:alkaline phytoceramidase [Gammaproteobacteria bacterium]